MELSLLSPRAPVTAGVPQSARISNDKAAHLQRVFLANVGNTVKLSFGNQMEEVRILSVDPDGLLCRRAACARQDAIDDWWIAYSDIEAAQLPIQAPGI